MNIQRIIYFVRLCETLHFTNTAAELNISQPALTKSIRQLEADLGLQLIRREGKRTHLTRNGQIAFQQFKTLVNLANNVESELRQLIKNKQYKVVIAIAVQLDFAKFAKFLKFFHFQYPKILIDILDVTYTDGITGLENGEYDCLLTIDQKTTDRNLQCIELFSHSCAAMYKLERPHDSPSTHPIESNSLHDTDGFFTTLVPHKTLKTPAMTMIRSTQLLWAQELVKAGVGYVFAPVGGSTIEGTDITEDDQYPANGMVIAAFPHGRSDNRALHLMSQSLQSFLWDE